ncbi:MAG: hypothetical protein ACRCT8_02650 [Lacipirellulaceae bacterium]
MNLRNSFNSSAQGRAAAEPSPPSATDDFNAAAGGPRETIATPEKTLELTPGGVVEQQVHEAIDKAARKQNRRRDSLVRGVKLDRREPDERLTKRFNREARRGDDLFSR